jgi:excisionase family DNA binding protein
MGSENSKDFYTFAEATRKLGRSQRAVYRYVERGVIRVQKIGKASKLSKEDVDNLAIDISTRNPPVNRQAFVHMAARLQKLEQDMAVLRRMYGVVDSPLRPSQEEAKALYLAATKALEAGKWRQDEIVSWADLYDRLDEVCLTSIGVAVGEDNPWGPFYKLCLAQLGAIRSTPDFSSSLDLQHLHQRLDAGRKVIRDTIVTWALMGKGGLPEVILDVLGGGVGSVERKLGVN